MTSTITDRLYGESSGVAVKAPVVAVAITNITLSGLGNVGSYTPNEGDRILVTAQADPTTNGIYNASESAWQRAGDFDGAYDCVQGTLVIVYLSTGAQLLYQLTTLDPVIGSSALTFVLFQSPMILPYPLSPAEIAAGLSSVAYPTYIWEDVRRYGAVLDGSTDCTAAMVIAAKVGGNIRINGTMALASASLAALPNHAITLKSATKIIGCPDGLPCVVTGSTACNVFYSSDASHISFDDFWCVGNGVGTSSLGYFWYIMCTSAATVEATGFRFIRGGLKNFAGYYWIYVDNTAATTYAFSNFVCDGSTFISQAGNAQGPTNIVITASVFGFSGSDTVTAFYTVKDVALRNCFANGQYIKNFVYFWSGNLRCKATDNTLENFGSDSSFSNDVGCYALAAYDHSHGTGLVPDEIDFSRNIIDVPRSCGIYAAGPNRITCNDNLISGQTDTVNTEIPKGAIAINAAMLPECNGNTINNCAIGVSLVQAPTVGGMARINNTTITQVPANGFGVIISGSTGGNSVDIGFNGLSIQTRNASVIGIYIVATSTVGHNDLDISNFDVTGAATGLLLFSPDSTVPAMGNVRITNGKFRKILTTNFNWPSATNAAQRLLLANLEFMDLQAGAVGLFLQSALGVTVRGITFSDMTSGATYCWYGGGTQGRLSNVQYNNVAVANRFDSSSNRLGVDLPAFSANDNDFVQNLSPTELGSSSTKYVVFGWVYDSVNAAWKQCRTATGN